MYVYMIYVYMYVYTYLYVWQLPLSFGTGTRDNHGRLLWLPPSERVHIGSAEACTNDGSVYVNNGSLFQAFDDQQRILGGKLLE